MMQGSVRKYEGKRGVTWTYVVDVGRAGNGKRIQKWRRGFPTKKAATEAMQLELHQRRSGTYIETSNETVGELLDRWLETVIRHKVKPTTLEDYAFTIRKHLKPALGSVPVQKLTPAAVQTFYADRLDAGLGARTVQLCHGRLSQALALALREGILTRNVCTLTDPPTPRPHPADVWTADESRRVIAASTEDLYAPLWLLALGTGLRRGELLGLRWQDIDLTRPTLSVRQTVVLLNNAPAFQTPKTSAAQRTIKLSAEIVAAMGKHRLGQIERRLAAPSWNDLDLVFCTSEGKAINPNSLYDRFDSIVARAGVKRIPLHGMRHTHATLLLAAGTPIKAVSERLGHSKTSITLDTYAHVLPDMQDRAVDAIDAALFQTAL
jgi:integrase